MNPKIFATRKAQRGMTLVELLLAVSMLAVGMGGLLVLFLNSTTSNNRNMRDTSGTLLAQMVLEQISAQHINSTATITLTDCTGTQWTVATAGGAAPSGQGASLDTITSSPTYGGILQSQAYSSIPANYAMQYTDCDANGHQAVYEVRWNVMTITTNSTRLITVSARQANLSSGQLGNAKFSIPVTLRGVAGT